MVELEQTTTSIVQIPSPEIIIASLREQASGLLQYATERVVQTAEDVKTATEDLSIIRKSKKLLEEKRKEYVTPLNNQVKLINDTFKLVSDPLNQADKLTTDKMLAYDAEQRRIRREQEAINQEKIDLARREAELNLGEFTVDTTPVVVAPEPPKKIQTDLGTAGQRDNWTWELMDINLVPREYLMVNAGMLTPIVKASKGRIVIPGIKIFNKPFLVMTR